MWLNILKNMISRKEAIKFYKSKTQTLMNLLKSRSDHQINLDKTKTKMPTNGETDTLFQGKKG